MGDDEDGAEDDCDPWPIVPWPIPSSYCHTTAAPDTEKSIRANIAQAIATRISDMPPQKAHMIHTGPLKHKKVWDRDRIFQTGPLGAGFFEQGSFEPGFFQPGFTDQGLVLGLSSQSFSSPVISNQYPSNQYPSKLNPSPVDANHLKNQEEKSQIKTKTSCHIFFQYMQSFHYDYFITILSQINGFLPQSIDHSAIIKVMNF